MVWYVCFHSSAAEKGIYQMVKDSWKVLHKIRHSFLLMSMVGALWENSACLKSCKRYIAFIRRASWILKHKQVFHLRIGLYWNVMKNPGQVFAVWNCSYHRGTPPVPGPCPPNTSSTPYGPCDDQKSPSWDPVTKAAHIWCPRSSHSLSDAVSGLSFHYDFLLFGGHSSMVFYQS